MSRASDWRSARPPARPRVHGPMEGGAHVNSGPYETNVPYGLHGLVGPD